MGYFPQFPGFGGRANINQNVTVKKGADVGGLLGGTPMDDGQALSLSILQAMPALQQAGYERSASPIGSIAKNLIPLVGSFLYAHAAQQQAAAQQQQQALENRGTEADIGYKQALTKKALSEGGAEGPKNLEQLLAQRIQAGQPITDVIAAMKQSQKPASSEWGARMEVAGGDPAAALAQKDAADSQHAAMMGQAAADLAMRKTAADEANRLRKPARALPEYRSKEFINKNTLEQAPNDIPTSEIESPDSPWKVIAENDVHTVRGAKQITQQLDRLEQLIPDVLPKSRWSLPISIAQQSMSEKKGPAAAEFDRLAVFEKLKGIRDLLTNGRINQTEVQQVGQPDRFTDDQGRAMAKVKAMRDLVNGSLSSMDLNPNALRAGPVEVDMDQRALGRAYNDLKRKYPKATDAELADLYRSQLQKSVGQ